MMKGLKGKLLTVFSANDTAIPILSYALPFNNFLFFFVGVLLRYKSLYLGSIIRVFILSGLPSLRL
jgi:hypothetical protein